MALGVLFALMEAMKIPAIMLLINGVINNTVTPTLIWQCFGILLASVIIGSFVKYHTQKDIEDMQEEFKYFRTAMQNYLFDISPTFIS